MWIPITTTTRDATARSSSRSPPRRVPTRPNHSTRTNIAAVGGAVVIKGSHSVQVYTELEGRVEEASEARRRPPPPNMWALLSEIPSFGRLYGAITILIIVIFALDVFWRAAVEEWVGAFDEPIVD